ncbi:hypothetical protein [Streptomyces hawaiiensis]|uniref:Molybdopterin oxidoreductase n=1 Tax=Streptomyces hawaiiensis TaxID=67305 RepID=A0A6G5RPV6_9ACTN|nr:hypothetical protein [Streptomyces hawaiiensis]QCD60195.1 hypothetical protein CEB94_39575 [Streptomyces hawaiiensis]
MNGVDLVLRALHHGEQHLAKELTTVAERHRTDHEVHHVATDLAHWSREHAQRLADTGQDRGPHLGNPPTDHSPGLLSAMREKAAQALGHRPEPALLLLRDLRDLHLAAAQNSLYWEMLAQAAQATRDDDLLALVSACHPQTLRQMRWTNTMIKNLSPQVLSSL